MKPSKPTGKSPRPAGPARRKGPPAEGGFARTRTYRRGEGQGSNEGFDKEREEGPRERRPRPRTFDKPDQRREPARRFTPRPEFQPSAPEAGEAPVGVLRLPPHLLQALGRRAAELGLSPEALATVWLSDKLR